MVMRVYIRRGPQSFHLENGINKSTSHHISPQSLDKTCQMETDSTTVTCINTLSCVYGLNVQIQTQCL